MNAIDAAVGPARTLQIICNQLCVTGRFWLV